MSVLKIRKKIHQEVIFQLFMKVKICSCRVFFFKNENYCHQNVDCNIACFAEIKRIYIGEFVLLFPLKVPVQIKSTTRVIHNYSNLFVLSRKSMTSTENWCSNTCTFIQDIPRYHKRTNIYATPGVSCTYVKRM